MQKPLILIVVTLLLGIAVAATVTIRMAQSDAARNRIYGRMGESHLALANHEILHGQLPARYATGPTGKATFSWLASVVSMFETGAVVFDAIDLTKAWDSPENAAALELGNWHWDRCTGDGYLVCALKSDESIWNSSDGSPRGSLAQFPDAIVFVAIPCNNIHPLQPFAVTDEELRQIVASGNKVLYIKADREYGIVRIRNGKIAYGE